MYIHAVSTIAFQPVFEATDFASTLHPISEESTIQHPVYKEFIPPMALRRMTEFVRMTIANGKKCIEGIDSSEVGGIIVGTALGSLAHTGKFMRNIMESEGGLISPTSFILSTHNTAAGQLSLELGCKGYNNTHVQNTLSFEHALLDAMLCLEEGRHTILVGSVDESEDMLFNTEERIGSDKYPTTFGSTFFRVDTAPTAANIKVVDTRALALIDTIQDEIALFLTDNNCPLNTIDEVLYATRSESGFEMLQSLFESEILIDYEVYTGSYLTSSSFATHLAYDKLKHQAGLKRILIVNNLISTNLGLTLLEKV